MSDTTNTATPVILISVAVMGKVDVHNINEYAHVDNGWLR